MQMKKQESDMNVNLHQKHKEDDLWKGNFKYLHIILVFLNQVNRLPLFKTNATKVLLVLIYSSGALFLFAFNNAVDWKLGFILAFGSSIGAWWSSRWSVERGEGVIKQILVIAVSVMAVKLWFF